MMPLEFNKIKYLIQERYYVLKINLEHSLIHEFESLGKLKLNILSVIFYNITFIYFVQIIYGKVKTIAGFNYDEMMILVFIGELTIILLSCWINDNADFLANSIYDGSFDLILNKPFPTVWYLTFKEIKILYLFQEGIPPLILIGLFIHWDKLNITPFNLFVGIIIYILGQIILECLEFIVACFEGFWDKRGLSVVFDQVLDDLGRRIPGEGYNPFFRGFLLTFFPIGIEMGLTTSVILGKFNPFLGVFIAIFATIFSLYLKMYIWNKGLKMYSSASS